MCGLCATGPGTLPLGAYHRHFGAPRKLNGALGAESRLNAAGATFTSVVNEAELYQQTCAAPEAGHAVGWFQGRTEFGPRALRGRSILGNPRNPEIQKRINLNIK